MPWTETTRPHYERRCPRYATHRRGRTSKPLALSDRLTISIVNLPTFCRAFSAVYFSSD